MDDELRTALWNVFSLKYQVLYKKHSPSNPASTLTFQHVLWHHFFRKATDRIPNDSSMAYERIREWFFAASWNEVYDFIEFCGNYKDLEPKSLRQFCNSELERENSACRFVSGEIAPITNEQEIAEVEEALAGPFLGVSQHLHSALKKLSDKENPDYRNSIKESISAVESICKVITGDEKATLGEALKKTNHSVGVHPALIKGFKKIYGYTSDSDGIRHSMTAESTCDYEDAKYMLVSCSAFIN